MEKNEKIDEIREKVKMTKEKNLSQKKKAVLEIIVSKDYETLHIVLEVNTGFEEVIKLLHIMDYVKCEIFKKYPPEFRELYNLTRFDGVMESTTIVNPNSENPRIITKKSSSIEKSEWEV